MPRRTITTIAAVGLIALGAMAGAGPASAATCPAGQHWNDMGGAAGFCSPDATGGGDGSTTPAPEAPTIPATPVYTPPAAAPLPTAPLPAPVPVQPDAPQAPDETPVTGPVPAQATTDAPLPTDIPQGGAPVSGTVQPAASLEEPVAQPAGAAPAAPGVTAEPTTPAAPSPAASASASPTAVQVGQTSASTAATIVFLLVAVAGTLGIVALLLVRHYRTPRRRTARAPRHLP